MQIVRLKTAVNTSYGVLEDGVVVEYWSPFRRGRRRLPLKHAVLLAPTLPSKIIGVELNYRDRVAEMGRLAPDEPRFFLKPTTPAGVGPLAAGDRVEVRIEEIGSLSNTVVKLG